MAKRSKPEPEPEPEFPQTPSKIPLRPPKILKLTTQIQTPALTLSTESEISLALTHLRSSDPKLAALIAAFPPPSFPSSLPPFHSLARTILHQQLATAAAHSIYTRFLTLCLGASPILLPESILSISPSSLCKIGVSSRKVSYLRDLAERFADGSLEDLGEMDDESLMRALTCVKGIGVWSVHMFMLFGLKRADVLPVGDLGVRKGVKMLYGLKEMPKAAEMEGICERWRPYRSVGAWYMWRFVEAKGVF